MERSGGDAEGSGSLLQPTAPSQGSSAEPPSPAAPRERCHQPNCDLQGGERKSLSSAWHFHLGIASFLASNLVSTSTTELCEQGTARSSGWTPQGTRHRKPPGEVQPPIPPKPKLTGAKIHPHMWRQHDRASEQEKGLLCPPVAGKAELPAPSQCRRAAR